LPTFSAGAAELSDFKTALWGTTANPDNPEQMV
jgi:hypothetical protein